MSGTHSSQGELTRRSFIKASGAAAGALGLAGAAGMTTATDWLTPTEAHAEPEEHIAYTYHQSHCGGHCSFKCTVREGRLCLLEPNDAWEDERYATCCLKGLSEIQHVYSAERIQTPLKRVGERGAGEFEAISWDEAYDILKTELTKIWDTYGKQAVLVRTASEASMPLLASILSAQTSKFGGIDMGIGNGLDPAFGGYGYATAYSDSRDWADSRFMLNVGCNYLESSLVQSVCFFEAKEAGCKIVTVDPHFSTTAQKSDEWVPINPGTDAALYLGMTTYILDNQLYDESFMKAHTSFPYLVSDDGSLLDLDPNGEAATNPKSKEPRAYAVWDTSSNSVKRFNDESVDPALEGSFEIEGKTYRTVFDHLRDNQKDYTLEWAAEKTGIPAEKIASLAEQYATSGASTLSMGFGGNDKMTNADIVGHAAAVLVALTGNAGKPGASVGIWAGGASGYKATLGAWKGLPAECVSSKSSIAAYAMRYEKNETHALISLGDTFQQSYANLKATEDWINSLDFICVMDIYHMTSVDYADLVLPICTKFECDEEIGGIKAAYGHILMREKVLDPLFESKPDYRVQYEIADLFGYGEFLPESAEEYARAQLENSQDKTISGITIETLKSHQGVQPQMGIEKTRMSYPDYQFGTKTKRIELYYEGLREYAQQLPSYEDPSEVYEGNPLREKYPLQFSQIRAKYHIHSQFFDAAWIRQHFDPYVELNTIEMERRALKTGDTVEVFNDRGNLVCKVRANEAVRPGVCRVHEGAWSKFVDEGNFQQLTNDESIERGKALIQGPVIPFNDSLVEVKKA